MVGSISSPTTAQLAQRIHHLSLEARGHDIDSWVVLKKYTKEKRNSSSTAGCNSDKYVVSAVSRFDGVTFSAMPAPNNELQHFYRPTRTNSATLGSFVNCGLAVIHVYKMDDRCSSTCGFEYKLQVLLSQSRPCMPISFLNYRSGQ